MNDQPSIRIYDDEILRHVDASGYWYASEPNPPCAPWCTDVHDPNEFRVTGLFTCSRDFPRGPLRVAAARTLYAGDQVLQIATDPIELSVDGAVESLTPMQAEALAALLVEAAGFAQQVQR